MTQEEVWTWAYKQWGDKALLRQKSAGPIYKIGFKIGKVFHVVGDGPNWKTALAKAKESTQSDVVLYEEDIDG